VVALDAYSQRVRTILTIAKNFIRTARVEWLRGDPLLMGAAIAYNALFALVPLTIAFVSLLHLTDLSSTIATRLTDLINATLPADIAEFLNDIISTSSSSVNSNNTAVLVLSLLVALWSGSRAVYAVQKSLRMIQAVPDQRGYLRARAVGIVVTVGSGVSVMVGYSLLLFGGGVWDDVTAMLGLGSVSLTQFSLGILIAVWVYGMLWAIYHFGPPHPVEHAAVVALSVEAVLFAGSWFAVTLLPADTRTATAAFGVLGVLLVLFYFIGVTVVATPIIVTSAWDALSEALRRYASEDEAGTVEREGSSPRSEPPGDTSQ
jgi:membrane protein